MNFRVLCTSVWNEVICAACIIPGKKKSGSFGTVLATRPKNQMMPLQTYRQGNNDRDQNHADWQDGCLIDR